MTLGDIIKNYRTLHGLSMDAFSDKSGISKAYISLLEKNKHPKTGKAIAPSIQSIKQAAYGMGMSFDDLFALIDGKVSIETIHANEPNQDMPRILEYYNQLNDAGKAEATKFTKNLTFVPDYTGFPDDPAELEVAIAKDSIKSDVG